METIKSEDGLTYLRPLGSSSGAFWAYKAKGPITQITICYAYVIDSISLENKSSDGVVVRSSETFGCPGRYKELKFCIDTSVEKLSFISVTQMSFDGESAIASLCFYTNRNKYEAFGTLWRGDLPVSSIPIEGGVFAGFHGYDGKHINAIGIIVAPKKDKKMEIEDLKTKITGLKEENDGLLKKMKEVEAQNEVLRERNIVLEKEHSKIEELETKIKALKEREVACLLKLKEVEAQNEELKERNKELEKEGKTSREEGLISLGPWGGKKGAYWAYKADGPMMQICVRYGQAIDSILFESKSSDVAITGHSAKIGCSGVYTTKTLCIDTSVEQLSSITLTYEDFCGEETIISLCFHTNKKNTYGPFGAKAGASSVSIPIEGGVFAGFHGLVGTYLTAIGIFVAPEVRSLHPIQDTDSATTQYKVDRSST